MNSSLDPTWTGRAPTMRVLDPLGAESTEARLQGRLLRPVNSIAITQRLRYLSYWAWVTAHIERVDGNERALYEKVLLVPSLYHDCPADGTGSNGIMGGDGLSAKLSDLTTDAIDISSGALSIGSNDKSRFESYYKGILYRLLLFENEWTLTPLGERLAAAYGEAVDFEFSAVREAVEQEELPTELIRTIADGGCLCQLSSTEQDLLIRSYWYLVSRAEQFDDLEFGQAPTSDLLDLSQYLRVEADDESEALIQATLAGAENVDVAEYSEDLDRFFITGRDAFVRSSLVLLIAAGDWVERRQSATPPFDALTDAREVWRLLLHAEYGSYALQAIFLGMQSAIRELEPIAPTALLTELFDSELFELTTQQALAGVSITEQGAGDRSVLSGIRDAVYYGEAPEGPIDAALPKEVDVHIGDWRDVCNHLRQADESIGDSTFKLSAYSEQAYQTLLEQTLREPPSLESAQRVVALGSVLLARLTTRYEQYYASDSLRPYVNWFQSAHRNSSVVSAWRLSDGYDAPHGLGTPFENLQWQGSEFGQTAATFSKHWLIDHYFDRLFEKIKDSNGRSPQLLHIDTDGRLTFDRQINSGELYNEGVPNAPTLKFDRLGDIFYELGLTEGNSLSEMQVTDRGRQLVTAFTDGGQK